MYRYLLLFLLSCALSPAATIYSLKNDFNSATNPNGVWSFLAGSNLLARYTDTTNSILTPALSTGYWGTGNSLITNTPEIFQALTNGSQAGETNNDFLAGDIVIHSANNSATPFTILWTAPTDGNISYSGSIWYAHSLVNRLNNFNISLNSGSALSSGLVSIENPRSNAINFSSGTVKVTAGDQLALVVTKTNGQTWGSLNGVDWNISYVTAEIPEPGTWVLLVSGAGLLMLRRRRS